MQSKYKKNQLHFYMSTIDYQKEKLRKAVPPPPQKKEKQSHLQQQ